MLIFGINLIFGIKFRNCPSARRNADTVIEFLEKNNKRVCDSQLCFWQLHPYNFDYQVKIQPETDVEVEAIYHTWIISDSENSYTSTNLFCSNHTNPFACRLNTSKTYVVNSWCFIGDTNFESNTYLDVVHTFNYREDIANANNVACIQHRAYLYDENECQQSSFKTLLEELSQTHKELLMMEMSDLFMGLIEEKIKFIELLENQTITLLLNKQHPFFCPEYYNYKDELQQFKLKLRNITDISQKIVDKKNLEPLIEYMDEILQDQYEKLKQMKADEQFSKIGIIQRHIISLNSQKNSLKSIDLLNGDFKHAQHLITSTFLLIEELQSLLL